MVMVNNPLYRNISQPYQQQQQQNSMYGSTFGNVPVAPGLGFQPGVPTSVGGMLSMTGLPAAQQAILTPATSGVPAQVSNVPVAPAAQPQPAVTASRRDVLPMAVQRPRVPLGEKLMRIGGAIVGGSEKGGLAAFQAGTDEFGDIMDRQRELGQVYDRDLNARMAASAAEQAAALEDNAEQIMSIEGILFDMQKARGVLTNPDGTTRDGVTGLFDGTIGEFLDRQLGNPEAAGRKILKKLTVDDTLLRVANTKGAISNKEMDLFLSPAPTVIGDDEQVWLDWIKDKEDALVVVLDRLRNNIVLPMNQRVSGARLKQFSTQFGTPQQSAGSAASAAPAAGQSSTFVSNGRQVPVKNVTPTK